MNIKITTYLGFLFVMIFPFLTKGQKIDNWKWQNPLPQGNTLHDVFMINEDTAVAVGNCGTIIKTIDGGNSWSIQSSGVNTNLKVVYFVNDSAGWVGGINGTLLQTKNGGRTWRKDSIGIQQHRGLGTPYHTVNAIDFYNEKIGCIAVSGDVYYTKNYGKTWIRPDSGAYQVSDIHFQDYENGWAVGDNTLIYHTENGGVTWRQIPFNGIDEVEFSHVQFVNDSTGWIRGERHSDDKAMVFKTTDKGKSWKFIESGFELFPDAHSTGMVVGKNGRIAKTEDGGKNWNVLAGELAYPLQGMFFLNESEGWAVGNYGTIIHTSDGGATWRSQSNDAHENLMDVHFIDSLRGWVVGMNDLFLRTTNGGQSWKRIKIHPGVGDLTAVSFIDDSTLISVMDMVRIRDGGADWQWINYSEKARKENIFDIFFIDSLRGWAVGGHGVIYHTVNGGKQWSKQLSGTNKWLYSVHFTDPKHGWAVGEKGTIIHTKNGGSKWHKSEKSAIQNLLKHGLNFFMEIGKINIVIPRIDSLPYILQIKIPALQ